MLATMVLLASVVFEPAVVFSILMSHLIPLFTVASGIRQMGLNCCHLSGRLGEPCIEQPIAYLIGATSQLRSLRVVTQSATIEFFPVRRAVPRRNQHSLKRLRAVRSGCMSPLS